MFSSEQETISTFRSADLPRVCIPADFESCMESSGSDNEGDFIFKVPTIPTDLTSATSTPTELGSTLSQVALYSQTSEESDNTAPAVNLKPLWLLKRGVGEFSNPNSLQQNPPGVDMKRILRPINLEVLVLSSHLLP